MYSEHLLKIKAKKGEIEHLLMLQGKHPHKAYVDRLLADIDTKLALIDYKKVAKGTLFDTKKFNEDINAIYEDLHILFLLIDEMAIKKYAELEGYVNGYLLSLEADADRADLKAREELEATTLNADVAYFGDASELSYNNEIACIYCGLLNFRPQSKVFGTVTGTGFELEDVVFEIGDKRISDYNFSGETLKLGGEVSKNYYTYEPSPQDATHSSFRVAVQDLVADESYIYEIYGGKNLIKVQPEGRLTYLEELQADKSYYAEANTTYTFYLHDATHIDFDFNTEPLAKNFTSYSNSGLLRDEFTKYEFTMKKGAAFTIITDGVTYATKEEPSVSGDELYIANGTIAKDFYVIETVPGEDLYLEAKVYIYNAQEEYLDIKSVAIKEIVDIAGGGL